jgi:hypothetical protein
MTPQKVTNADVAFPANVRHLMPPNVDEIRRKRLCDPKWERFASQWFFKGADDSLLIPKQGIDKTEALRHIKCILGSFQPSHEDKDASVAYLLGEWFEPLSVQSTK